MADTDDSREKRRAYKNAWRRAWRANPANQEKNKAEIRAWRAANPEKVRKQKEEWVAKNREWDAYTRHRGGARQRNIPFLLTFEEWWDIWQASGKWEQRGSAGGQYVMARFGDRGPYAWWNVRICTAEENISEGHRGKRVSEATRKRMSEQGKTRPVTDVQLAALARGREMQTRRAKARRHANDDPQFSFRV